MASVAIWTVSVLCVVGRTWALDNGLALTPPMGWLAWERFRCNTDCKNDPENCISDRLFRTMTDILVSEGYAAVGYEYINVDDCWPERERDPRGKLVADRERFPYGMKSLSDYVHSKGLKFGIYEDYGNFTCAGYPGVVGHLAGDAATFAAWDVDYVKLDGCYALPADMDHGYPEFGRQLNLTGRQMVYSCSWPVYQIYAGMQPNFSSIIEHCNLWRNFDDIQDSWASVESIIDYYGNHQDVIVPNAGPGHWNDPDMLIIGNFGLSYEQSKTQFAIWAILAAPLLMSVDLRTIRPEYKAILQNRKIIEVDQDPLGIQGRRIYKHRGIEIWSRPILPIQGQYYSYAVAFVNRRTDGTPSDVAVTLRELGLNNPAGYRVEDLYEDVDYGVLSPQTKIKVKVNPSGCSGKFHRHGGRGMVQGPNSMGKTHRYIEEDKDGLGDRCRHPTRRRAASIRVQRDPNADTVHTTQRCVPTVEEIAPSSGTGLNQQVNLGSTIKLPSWNLVLGVISRGTEFV